MTKQIWINLPVKDIARSKAFFTAIGFKLNERYGNSDQSASFLVGDKQVVVMLFTEDTFSSFTGNELVNTSEGSEVLFSLDAESRDEVEEMATKAEDAGGTVFGLPQERQGWMYGCGFADPDGHRWNVLYMDMSKMPGQV
ncbi:extradiol dioxygenase [Segetibacter sp. 3557_3]|uniref:VOC family protein n=1 Tax=Segetibacter sp. 3557_3 TaxID=2547429 RepID=UPI001058F61C|nr:VOC family protein [Segetibacter sp. 3557_3]TDH28939.1 extradiol dioxygenase [Segetibacter sp. 3557_3]